MNEMKRTREEILLKIEEAKRRKKTIAEELIQDMKAEYEKTTGKKANYTFVL